jgi:hypothetical protein
MKKMQFWKGNRLDAEFEMTPAEVAAAFRAAVLADEHELRLMWVSQLLTRTLLTWMCSDWGLDASWEDVAGFEQILDLVFADKELQSL